MNILKILIGCKLLELAKAKVLISHLNKINQNLFTRITIII